MCFNLVLRSLVGHLLDRVVHSLILLFIYSCQRRDYSVLVPFLPRKHEYVIKVRVSALQEKLYRHFLNTFIFQEGDFSKKGRNDFS